MNYIFFHVASRRKVGSQFYFIVCHSVYCLRKDHFEEKNKTCSSTEGTGMKGTNRIHLTNGVKAFFEKMEPMSKIVVEMRAFKHN